MSKHFSEEQELQVVESYQRLGSAVFAGRELGIASTTVYNILKRRDIPRVGHDNPDWRLGSRRKFTPEQRLEIRSRYESGDSVKRMAQEYGCAVEMIRTSVRRAGGRIRPKGARYKELTATDMQAMIEMWREGKSQTAIGKSFGLTQTNVSRILRGWGETPRPRYARHSWKGGLIIHISGYRCMFLESNDPLASMRQRGGYVAEHRLVMAKAIGRPLTEHETVHHINGIKDDNRLENLQLRQGAHGKGSVWTCEDCGSTNVVSRPLAEVT